MAKNDKEVAVRLGWSWKGVTAKFDVRTLAALDALGADKIWEANNERARRNAVEKAKREAEVLLTETAGKVWAAQLKKEPSSALKLLTDGIGTLLDHQTNRQLVALHAYEDLQKNPPSATQLEAGPDKLSPEFISHFSRYASEATTAELKERWGLVLAQELRQPGTFGQRVLRAIDETDRETAEEFSEFLRQRIRDFVPYALYGREPTERLLKFGFHDLVSNPTVVLVEAFVPVLLEDGTSAMALLGEQYCIIAPHGSHSIANYGNQLVSATDKSPIGVSMHHLTPVGHALGLITEYDERSNFERLASAIQSQVSGTLSIRHCDGLTTA